MSEKNGLEGDISRWDGEGGSSQELDRLVNLRKFVDELSVASAPVEEPDSTLSDIRDILMLQAGLMMRLYDVNMRLLGSVDEEGAAALWEKHSTGMHENPPTMVPTFERTDDEEDKSSS